MTKQKKSKARCFWINCYRIGKLYATFTTEEDAIKYARVDLVKRIQVREVLKRKKRS